MGELIGKRDEDNYVHGATFFKQVRTAFFASYDFAGKTFTQALRMVLTDRW